MAERKLKPGCYFGRHKGEEEWTAICFISGEAPFFKKKVIRFARDTNPIPLPIIIGPRLDLPPIEEDEE